MMVASQGLNTGTAKARHINVRSDSRRVFETAGQWPHLSLAEQHSVLGSFQYGVSLMHDDGSISEDDLTHTYMGMPPLINRSDLDCHEGVYVNSFQKK